MAAAYTGSVRMANIIVGSLLAAWKVSLSSLSQTLSYLMGSLGVGSCMGSGVFCAQRGNVLCIVVQAAFKLRYSSEAGH